MTAAGAALVFGTKRGSPDIAALSLMVGFAVMMTLDVALSWRARQSAFWQRSPEEA